MLTRWGGRGAMAGSRWTEERAARWALDQPWLVGCNFTPSTASNQLEMWQPETFDSDTIARELRWASDMVSELSIGKLSDFGFQESQIPELVEKAQKASSMRGNRLPLPDEILTAILQQAL